MLVALLVVLVLTAVFGPQLWAQYILKHHSRHRDEIPGTGGELAILEHAERIALAGVVVAGAFGLSDPRGPQGRQRIVAQLVADVVLDQGVRSEDHYAGQIVLLLVLERLGDEVDGVLVSAGSDRR